MICLALGMWFEFPVSLGHGEKEREETSSLLQSHKLSSICDSLCISPTIGVTEKVRWKFHLAVYLQAIAAQGTVDKGTHHDYSLVFHNSSTGLTHSL